MPDPKKPEPKKNIGASVRARLLTISKANGQVFDLVLNRYAVERLLYRLSVSAHARRFVLKGATLLMTWLDAPHRGTRDLDLLSFGDPDGEEMLAVFREMMAANGDDGIVFDVAALKVERIREHLAYGGLRLVTTADIGGARVRISIDIGFGDALGEGLRCFGCCLPFVWCRSELLDDSRGKIRFYGVPESTLRAFDLCLG